MSADTLDFALFEQALDIYNKDHCINKKKTNKCPHTDIINEEGVISCLDCGEQLERTIRHDKEWRFYGYSDNKKSGDPNRVQMRKSDVKSINKDIDHMGFNDNIVTSANDIYNQVTQGQIFRGDSRKAVIFACVFHAYKIAGKYQTPKNLMDTFGLNKKSSLKGLKIVNISTPKTTPFHSTPISTLHHIYDIMTKISATSEQIKEVINLYKITKNKSSNLNRSRPQSQASALVFYWIKKNNINISLKVFAQKVDLSELTIQKNTKEIYAILDA